MSESRLEHLDRAVLLAVWSKRPKPPSLLELRSDLLLCVPAFGSLGAERAVDAAIVRAIKSGRVERVPPATSREKVERFALTAIGENGFGDAFGSPAHDTWKRTYPKVLGAETVTAVRDRAVDFDFLRAFVLARALGLDERVLHAKTDTDVLNIIAAATVKAPNAEPDTIRDVLVRRWIAEDATVETYASDDDADFLLPVPAPKAEASSRPKTSRAASPASDLEAAPSAKPAKPKRASKAKAADEAQPPKQTNAPKEPKQPAVPKQPKSAAPRAKTIGTQEVPRSRTESDSTVSKPKRARESRATGAGGAPAPRKRKPSAQPVAHEEPAAAAAVAPLTPDLEAFAVAVRDAAKSADGRVGRRAFVNRVWNVFRHDDRAAGMSLATFKELLALANRRQLVSLSRADLPQSFSADDVRESAVKVLGDDVHFITVEDDR